MNEQLFLGLGYLAAGFGAGIVLLAAAFSIARLASVALEGTARQPEAAGNLRVSMIIPAAFIEGLGLFGLVVCFLLAVKAPTPPVAPAAAAPAATAPAGR